MSEAVAEPLGGDPVLRALLARWRGWRRGRELPSRADVDPVELGPLVLPHLALTERVRAGGPGAGRERFRFRLCGTALAQGAGVDLTGKYVDEVNPHAAYTVYIEGLYRRAIEARLPVYSESEYATGCSLSRRMTRRLMCPLSGDGREVDMFITAQTFRAKGTGELPTMTYADSFVPGPVVVVEE